MWANVTRDESAMGLCGTVVWTFSMLMSLIILVYTYEIPKIRVICDAMNDGWLITDCVYLWIAPI